MAQSKSLAQMDVSDLLKNPKVVIGLAVGAVVILIVVLLVMFLPKGGNTGPVEGVVPGIGDNGPGALIPGEPGAPGTTGAASAVPGDIGSADSGAMAPGATGMGMGMGMGAAAAGGAPADGAPAKPDPAGIPTRKNPFLPNSDLKEVVDNIVKPPSFEIDAPSHDIYQNELYVAKPPVEEADDDSTAGPPPPPMRVSGVILGDRVSALLQMGSEFMQITPGMMIPRSNPVYRVEKIEARKVTLTRKWEDGDRSGTQRLEVELGPASRPGGAGMGGGFPGGMGGFGGGGAMGGNAPGGPAGRLGGGAKL